ncbi:bifunctional adenosylcobinamide kinase/adenosylcobinamide-phosphate guanylyltransferase [Ruminiclostridium cellulolyticum]|uniref:Adenosylcobinamide kinase n=1 Tax=Ruminiclostridium cellulolyticum (strain ATCC 35319 / DSM 5812 / JCM 6584 / H10) TaxID=394503 RepID=B8I7A1_RUMCH|nr:bifunctional adenosylcobinamide kinase/adenosylcobinamide-phosphate guanylyltransferase [Ruminiclostridium cellulolyticum]ACL75025.1 cobalbumin biosynthesis protein [Ruminiclostridium cellulolyticum H10]
MKSEVMGEIVLVTGGARSGKSTFAEKLAKEYGSEVLYVATAIPLDDEMRLRIKKHREQRPANWETVETYKDMDILLEEKYRNKKAVLLDCITVMIANIMFEVCHDFDKMVQEDMAIIEEAVNLQMDKLIVVARSSGIPFILVTNETGMGIVPENKSARLFRDIQGRANQKLAAAAKEVFLCVSGIPVKIK